MSGDVQPRKRKDKKKRKDDSDKAAFLNRKMSEMIDDEDVPSEKTPPASGVNAAKMGPDDIQLHVHSEHGTGGHWCAKIFFFSLMAILAGLIGLILLENRGLSDLDTPLSESRYADYLEGWVDEKRESPDEHDILESLHELDEHDHDNEPFAEEEDHDDEDSNEHGDEDDEHNEEHDDDDEHDDANDITDHEDDNDDDEGNDSQENATTESQEGDEEETDKNDDDHDDENVNDEDNDDKNKDNDDGDNDDEGYEEENDKNDDDNDTDDKDSDDTDKPFEEKNYSLPATALNKVANITTSDELASQVDELYDIFNEVTESINSLNKPTNSNSAGASQKEEDDDDDDASMEEVIDNDAGEELHLQKLAQKQDQPKKSSNDDGEEEAQESSSLAVKIGIGFILVVVAHLVLVKKWQSSNKETADETEEQEISMRRRLTLVTAEENVPSDEDEQPIDFDDEGDLEDEAFDEEEDDVEYSEEEIDEIGGDEENATNLIGAAEKTVIVPKSFEELNAMYRPTKNLNQNETDSVETKTTTPITTSAKFKEELNKDNEKDKNDSEMGNEDCVEEDDVEYDDDEEEEDGEVDEDDEEMDDGDEEEISDVDDNDLMKRLESKYGKLPENVELSEDEEDDDVSDDASNDKWTKVKKTSGVQSNIYDDDEDDIEEELRMANALLEDNPQKALAIFDSLLLPNKSINKIDENRLSKIWYGKARAEDELADKLKSNDMLNQAIVAYVKSVEYGSKLPDGVFKMIAQRCLERMKFIGQHTKAISIHEKLIERFNNEPSYRNDLAVTYLLLNRLTDAKYVLHETLLKWRHDGFAAVHYGFVLKNLDQNMEAAVQFLREGIQSDAIGTQDGRFYFNLGDALQRLGRQSEAMDVYRLGAKKKLFLSEYQRSLYNVNRLKSRPFWTIHEIGYEKNFKILLDNWPTIRDEGMSVLNAKHYFTNETENLKDIGDWRQFTLFARGHKNAKNCQRTPITCNIIETFPAARFCTRGQIKFSVMHPGTHVWPHCGPTNCRIRAHLGLNVPENTFLRVATERRSWKNGELLIFDDSFEHEVWHNGTSVRLVLIIDVWHPDLTETERKTMVPI